MPELDFSVSGAEAAAFSASPLVYLKVRVASAGEPVAALALRCQVQIEPARRGYGAAEAGGLSELFGAPSRFGETMRPLLWAHTDAMVPAFAGEAAVDLPLPCSFDMSLGAAKYFYALAEGEAPLRLLFSGSIFYAAEAGLRVAPVPWSKEARFRLPLAVWREAIDRHYAGSAGLMLRRDVFDRLYRFRARRGLPTWEQALEALLPPEEP
jgi:hypothetical protein